MEQLSLCDWGEVNLTLLPKQAGLLISEWTLVIPFSQIHTSICITTSPSSTVRDHNLTALKIGLTTPKGHNAPLPMMLIRKKNQCTSSVRLQGTSWKAPIRSRGHSTTQTAWDREQGSTRINLTGQYLDRWHPVTSGNDVLVYIGKSKEQWIHLWVRVF
jgi:hypothetical protein